jgi:hypothetical protein
MSSYRLEFRLFDQDGEWTGETIPLAHVKDGKVTGKMRRAVEQQISLGTIQIGLTGPVEPVTFNTPDLVAYALSLRTSDLWDAGVTDDGAVVAIDEDDKEIRFMYANDPPTSDILGLDDQEEMVATVPLD